MSLRCSNCQCHLKFDPSISERYPEWQNLCLLSKPAAAIYRQQSHPKGTAGGGTAANGGKEVMSLSATSNASGHSRGSDISQLNGLAAEAQQHSFGNLGHSTAMVGNLFDLICNDVTAIDNPMCQECTDKLLDCMDQQMKLLEEECKEYSQLLTHLKNSQSNADLHSLKVENLRLQSEEAGLRSELARLEAEEVELDKKLAEEEKELSKLSHEEELLWKSSRDISRQLLLIEEENRSASNQLHYANCQLEKLQKTSAFNLTFHIWYDGHFGTINGFKLGRLPNCAVDWPEINAAWGQTALLLHCLRKKIGLTFDRFEIVPYGSHSFVRCLLSDGDKKSKNDSHAGSSDDVASTNSRSSSDAPQAPPTSGQRFKELPLFCSGGYKFFWDTKFDSAMVAFLDCLQQFKQRLDETGGGCLPYKMQKDKIEDKGNEFSVKIQFNSEERWTKAMKCMLTNLKWALVCVSSMQ